MLAEISKRLLTYQLLWRILGFVSSIVGFTCFALSPSFYDLFGRWNLLKSIIYSVTSLILTTLMLLVKKCEGSRRRVLVKAHVGFLVLMLTSLCSVWEDQVSHKEDERMGLHGRILNLCSLGAFGLMSLSWSRQLELGFEVGIFNFLFGSFLVMLIKINFKLIPLAAFLCYVLIHIRSFSDFWMETCGPADSGDTQLEDIESGSRSIPLQGNNEASADLMEQSNVPEQLNYKNRLQEHAQKSHIQLPTYQSVDVVGLGHAPQYRSTVWVDGNSYTSNNLFPRKTPAEEDIAKLAFQYIKTGFRDEGLSLILQRPKSFKSILNDYTTRRNLDKTQYEPQEGRPDFISSLVFNGRRYTGDRATSKKEAEQYAACAAVVSNLESFA